MITEYFEKFGEKWKLFTLRLNGVQYYMIGSIKGEGIKYIYTDSEMAVIVFDFLEKHM